MFMFNQVKHQFINWLLSNIDVICPVCKTEFTIFKNHAGLQLGIPIYCCMECYLSCNPNPYET